MLRKHTLILPFLVFMIILSSCDRNIHPDLELKNIPVPKADLNGIQALVQYNSAHNVLMFNSFNDLEQVTEMLAESVVNYTYNQGSTTQILQQIDQIKLNGFSTNSNSQNNGVDQNDFSQLLSNSHPLGNQVLLELLQLQQSNSLPPTFLKGILLSNLPLGYDVLKGTENSNLPASEISEIAQADDASILMPNYAFEDFLNLFPGYNSLYAKVRTEELNQLKAGMDPADPAFGNSLIGLEIERLLINDKQEIYIEGALYRMYTDCKAIAMKGLVSDAYSELQTLDQDGNVIVPGLTEGPQGIAMNDIDNIIPTGYMTFNPQEFEPTADENDDPYLNTALQKINRSVDCPISNFAFEVESANDFRLKFWNDTYLDDYDDPSQIIQYWQFGDGTGSFQTNPSHDFPGFGTYYVSLTTFSKSCGCWHVHRIPITINTSLFQGRNPECPIESVIALVDKNLNGKNEVTVTVNLGSPAVPGNTVEQYLFQFYSLDPYENPTNPSFHDHENGTDWQYTFELPFNGEFWVIVKAFWVTPCEAESIPTKFYAPLEPGESLACCDTKERFKFKDKEIEYDDNRYKIVTKDVARGTISILGKQIGGQHKVYKKRKYWFGWKDQDAFHAVDVSGLYSYRPSPFPEICQTVEYHNRFYRSGSAPHAYFPYSKTSFDHRFGLKFESLVFTHSVYLGGSMTFPLGEPAVHVGGYPLIEDKIKKLGVCE